MIRKGAPAYLIQCHQLEMLTSNLVNKEAPKVQELNQKHEKVFQDLPMKLPPKREINHTIEVKSGSNPINIKSYRYPHHQKPKLKDQSKIF